MENSAPPSHPSSPPLTIHPTAAEPCPNIPKIVSSNILNLVEGRLRLTKKRGWSSRIAEASTKFAGRMSFLWAHLALFAAWIVFNDFPRVVHAFDPYPYPFLTFVVSLDAIVLAILVLIAQNEMQEDSDRRAELDLHINLLAENEITMMLRKLSRIEDKLGITVEDDELVEARELLKGTRPDEILDELERQRDLRNRPGTKDEPTKGR